MRRSLVERFREALEAVGGEASIARTFEEAMAKAADLASSYGAELVLGVRLWEEAAEALEEALTGRGVKLVRVEPLTLIDSTTMSGAEVSVGAAEYGVAESGTILYFTRAGVEEAAIFAPRAHISILSAERLYETLPEVEEAVLSALERGLSTFLITGPSCTADIEGELVRGVHGSQRLHVVILWEGDGG